MGKSQLATTLNDDILRELRIYAAENDQQLNQVVENALYLWFAISKDKDWHDVAQCMPGGSFIGSTLQQIAYDKDAKMRGFQEEDKGNEV